MSKKSSFIRASVAALVYFVIFVLLKYSLQNHMFVDWQGAFIGAVVFWFVIFLVHQFLNRECVI